MSFLANRHALFSPEKGASLMKINYKDADGRVIGLEVSEDVGTFYLESVKEEKRNDRKETRRHTLLSSFDWRDEEHLDSGIDIQCEIADSAAVEYLLSPLSERHRYLIQKCIFDGWSYADLAKLEGKNESSIRLAVNLALKKIRKNFS